MTRFVSRIVICVSFLLPVLLLAVAGSAAAQPGVRGGVSIDPDQAYFGAHYETAPLIDRLYFRPNVEAGVGDDLTHVGLNMEFVYKFPRRRQGWVLYVGGGPAVNFYTFDRPGDNDTNTEGGLNLMIGVEHSRGWMFEIKVGALDSPDVKFGVGWTFR
ncbi:MAG: hypothetical protein ACRD2N_23725 [Vicinamibacterales bacterium]